MKSFRNPKYHERYEDVIFDLERALQVPGNNGRQRKDEYRFIADNTGETTPFDWYNARLSMDFKVIKTADGANIDADGDNIGTVNGANSFIDKMTVLANGRELYSCNYAYHAVHIKNLLEYNPSYANSVATKEFYYLDSSRAANRNAANNSGYAARKVVLGDSATVNCEIPLNRYSFFEALGNKLLPNTKIELNFEITNDNILIFRAAGNDSKVVITRLQLFVPKLTFNDQGQKMYDETFIKPFKWTFLREVVEISGNTQQQTGHFKVTSAVTKPRHVFIWAIDTARIANQEENPFFYDTFNLPNNANIR